MRKAFTLISAAFCFLHISAQQALNPGFEVWTAGSPSAWSTSHTLIPASTLETQETSVVYQGTSAVKMTTSSLPSPASGVYPGFVHAWDGYYDATAGQFVLHGEAFAYRPDSLQFAYFYTPNGTDSGNVTLTLYKGAGSNIGTVDFNFHRTFSYEIATVPIRYSSSQVPDSMNLTFYSGDRTHPHAGSVLYIDAVNFIYNPVTTPSGIESTPASYEFKAYPNPASDKLFFNCDERLAGGSIRVYNMLGSEVLSYEINSVHAAVDLTSLYSAIYIYRVYDASQKTVLTGKFTKE